VRKHESDPVRLADLPAGQDPADVAMLVRSATPEAPADLPLIKWRICRTLRRRGEQRQRAVRIGLVATLFFVTGGVVGAVVQPILLSRISAPSERSVPPAPAARARIPHGRAKPRPAAEPTALEPEATMAAPDLLQETAATRPAATVPAARPPTMPEPAVSRPATPRAQPTISQRWAWGNPPARTQGPTHPPEELPAVVPAKPTPDEQALLTRALQGLRIARDPEEALAALDEYVARFPQGALASEAARLRTEALLLTGRKTAALAELDRIPAQALPASDERRVLRGELRATAGRWREALADFDVVTVSLMGSHKMPDAKSMERLERALWGRASARSRLGDDGGARADLRDYLRLFPSGRFAAEAARLSGRGREGR
jgi:hypothetical protein